MTLGEEGNTICITDNRAELPQLPFMPPQPERCSPPQEWPCHSPLPIWDAAANTLESGQGTVAACDSPGGTSAVKFKP